VVRRFDRPAVVRQDEGEHVVGSERSGDRSGSPSIGITGAAGFIGSQLTQRALDEGIRVRTFTRRTWDGAPLVPAEDRRELMLPRRPDPADFEGLDAVIHLAVAAHGSSESVTRAVNIDSTVALYEAARAAGVPRFVFVSSQSAHDGARNLYGRSNRAAERLLEGKPGVLIVRPGLVYDGSDKGLLGLASGAAAKLRMFPVMGGKDAKAQTIHMDDLCATLIRFSLVSREPDVPELLELAEPTLWPLGELVASTAEVRTGVRPKLVNIPLGFAKGAAKFGKAVKVGEAVSEVVDGIVAFRPMDTGPVLAALGIELRPFDAKTAADRDVVGVPAEAVAPARIILVGSGRIGSVHALCAMHHPDAVLVGLVDPSKGAAGRIQSLIGAVPHYATLDEALAEAKPTAAIIATPPFTHAEIAEKLLAVGVDVLVEKPVTPKPEHRAALKAAAEAALATSGASVGSGYHFVQLPHLREARDRFLSGEFGNLEGFCALGFVSRAVPRGKKLSWELDPERAGGGALPQVAAHVMSALDLFIGPFDVLDATMLVSPDRLVEDATWVHLTNGSVSGSLFTGWHMSEFVIPENTARLQTDRGTLVLTSAAATFFPHDTEGVATGEPIGMSCFDAPVAFDPAPNDGGAGYWLEQRAMLAGRPDRNGLDAAERIERVTNQAYEKAQRVRREERPVAGTARPVLRVTPPAAPGFIDVRRLHDQDALARAPHAGARYVVGTSDFAALAGSGAELMVVAPDIAKAFRTVTNEGPVELVKALGFANLVKSGLGLNPIKALPPTGRIWEAFGVFLRAELASIPHDFDGRIALDGYLVDLAGALGKLDEIAALVRLLHKKFPQATIGLDSNAPALATSIIPALAGQIGFVLAVGAPGASVIDDLRAAAGSHPLDVFVKTGIQPHEVVAWASADPQPWAGRGDVSDVVVDWRGAPDFAPANIDLLTRAIRATGCPDWAFADACEALGLTRPAEV
jgi:predicted dehydrogenase/nucleoside-diphosphate-sugar epimerase